MTKIHHACLTIDDGRTRLLLDPGQLGRRPGLDGIDAVLITHRHSDHLDPDLVEEALRRGIPVWAPGDALDELGGLGARGEDGLHEAVTGTTSCMIDQVVPGADDRALSASKWRRFSDNRTSRLGSPNSALNEHAKLFSP